MKRRGYEIIGAAFDLGSDTRGSADAPRALREKGLLKELRWLKERGVRLIDGGDVHGPVPGDSGSADFRASDRGATDADSTDSRATDPRSSDSPAAPRHTAELVSFSHTLMEKLRGSYESGRVPVVIGGDHSISIPSVSAAAALLRETQGPEADLGLIWVDAHPDLEMPETSSSGDLHAMAVSHLLGYGVEELSHLGGFSPKVKPANLILIGLRDVLPEERAIIREKRITAYAGTDVERLGITHICEQAFSKMSRDTAGFVLSFDIDACDPLVAPAVEYPERGGLTYREAALVMEFAAAAEKLICLEMVEVNPALDKHGATSEVAVDLIRSAVGGSIL